MYVFQIYFEQNPWMLSGAGLALLHLMPSLIDKVLHFLIQMVQIAPTNYFSNPHFNIFVIISLRQIHNAPMILPLKKEKFA